jgi:hypothetical protein
VISDPLPRIGSLHRLEAYAPLFSGLLSGYLSEPSRKLSPRTRSDAPAASRDGLPTSK